MSTSEGPDRLLTALDDATRAIAGVLEVDRVLQLIVDRVRPLVGAQYAALGIVGADGTIERFVTSGIDAQTRRRIGPPPRGHGLLGLVIRDNRPIRVRDITLDERSHGFPPAHPEMHSFLGVPVTVKGESVGNLYLTNKQGADEFTDDDERLVGMFARHAGIAIDNARLHAEVRRLAVVAERDRIGQDLHDGVMQALYAVGLSLEDVSELLAKEPEEAAARVERAIDAIHGTIADVRQFVHGLRPRLLADLDLRQGLASLAEEYRLSAVTDVEVELDDVPNLGAARTTQLLHLAREALSNVARHAGASRVVLRAYRQDGEFVMIVSDNGRGFAPGVIGEAGHHGLSNMHERAAAAGGSVTIHSTPKTGTTVRVEVPVIEQGQVTAEEVQGA